MPLSFELVVAVVFVCRARIIKSNPLALAPLNLLRRKKENNTARTLYSGLPTLFHSHALQATAGSAHCVFCQ